MPLDVLPDSSRHSPGFPSSTRVCRVGATARRYGRCVWVKPQSARWSSTNLAQFFKASSAFGFNTFPSHRSSSIRFAAADDASDDRQVKPHRLMFSLVRRNGRASRNGWERNKAFPSGFPSRRREVSFRNFSTPANESIRLFCTRSSTSLSHNTTNVGLARVLSLLSFIRKSCSETRSPRTACGAFAVVPVDSPKTSPSIVSKPLKLRSNTFKLPTSTPSTAARTKQETLRRGPGGGSYMAWSGVPACCHTGNATPYGPTATHPHVRGVVCRSKKENFVGCPLAFSQRLSENTSQSRARHAHACRQLGSAHARARGVCASCSCTDACVRGFVARAPRVFFSFPLSPHPRRPPTRASGATLAKTLRGAHPSFV